MPKLAELSVEELYGPGHRMCAGCGGAVTARMSLKAMKRPTYVVQATGCMEVASTIYPFTAWKVPWAHGLFENAAAIASGVETYLKSQPDRKNFDLIVLGGDGGTFDIGIQALSGAFERRHDFTYICYDNEAYMNTGIQRSSATPEGAWTTTTPVGKASPGKLGPKKDLAAFALAHHVDYVATACVAYWSDFLTKIQKAADVEGPALVHAIAPCPLGWRFPTEKTIQMGRLAVQSRYFPLYEVEKGKYKLSVNPHQTPLDEFLKMQGRFSHLFKPEYASELATLKAEVEARWLALQDLCAGKHPTW
ncbi:MAG TPA: thiamine pyrophosphate-dependent enzyme [Terriglobales bacterium]|nr:thiamine pyrophosphate-dependent enzyme [Terriglobales bacterium]